jgi:hypothetical protein
VTARPDAFNEMNKKMLLIVGDILAIAVITFIGFASHGEGNISFLPRMATTFFPVLTGWFLLAPWFGLFDENVISTSRSLWRIPLAMLFAAPLASTLRAALLGTTTLPIFTLILAFTSTLGVSAWRVAHGYIVRNWPTGIFRLY